MRSPSPDGQTRQQALVAEDASEDHADEDQQQDALDHDDRGEDRQPRYQECVRHGR